MKKIYIINYDLNRTGQDYTGLIIEIKNSSDYIKYLKSGWIIATAESPAQIFGRLKSHLDSNDLILINEVTKNYYGWLTQSVWDWLQKYGL